MSQAQCSEHIESIYMLAAIGSLGSLFVSIAGQSIVICAH